LISIDESNAGSDSRSQNSLNSNCVTVNECNDGAKSNVIEGLGEGAHYSSMHSLSSNSSSVNKFNKNEAGGATSVVPNNPNRSSHRNSTRSSMGRQLNMDELSADSEALISDFEEIKINPSSNQRQTVIGVNGKVSSNVRGSNKLPHHFSSFSNFPY
jgi:hypothetical protein